MIKLVHRVRLIMRMEKLIAKYGHLTTVSDFDNLLKEKEAYLDEIEKQEPVSEV